MNEETKRQRIKESQDRIARKSRDLGGGTTDLYEQVKNQQTRKRADRVNARAVWRYRG